MQNQYINEMLGIPELEIHQILPMSAEELHIEVTPVAQKQCCPICRSDEFVILKGSNGMRKVRHLPAFEKKVYLLLSSIRMHCSKCEAGFVWDYLCVGPKKRYSHLFRERAAEQAWKQAKESDGLVLGVDDFAIKKGHTYNTGIHDLKGEMMLDLLPGRKLEDLRTYAQHHPDFLLLEPKAVVMDLARAYHTWISECDSNCGSFS
jgi:transposase